MLKILQPLPSSLLLRFCFVRFVRHIGSGQFFRMDEGRWKQKTHEIPVSIRTLMVGASEKDKVMFLQEAMLMAQFQHLNVIMLYGMIIEGDTVSYFDFTSLLVKKELSHRIALFFSVSLSMMISIEMTCAEVKCV